MTNKVSSEDEEVMEQDVGRFVRRTPLKTGFHPPEQCVRGCSDCRSLAQIISEGTPEERTFMCVGERQVPDPHPDGDHWTFCHRSIQGRAHIGHVDFRIFVNRRDMSHMAAVLSMGLATVIPCDETGEARPPAQGSPNEDPS